MDSVLGLGSKGRRIESQPWQSFYIEIRSDSIITKQWKGKGDTCLGGPEVTHSATDDKVAGSSLLDDNSFPRLF